MQKNRYNQISPTQFVLLIFLAQTGLGVISLPRDLAETAGTDGWISLLLGWIVAILVHLMIVSVMAKHPYETIYELLPRYFGKWIGTSFSLLWILYSGFLTTHGLLAVTLIIQSLILPNTSYILLMILFLIPIYMITRHGLAVIGRFAQYVFLISLWLPFVILYPLEDVDWLNLLPIGKEGWAPILSTIRATVPAFISFEITYILYPFLRNKRSVYKQVIIANSLTMLVYLQIIIICFIKFSVEELRLFVWPTLNLLKLIKFPFMERLEVVYICFDLFILFAAIIPYLYMFVLGTTHLSGRQDHRPHLRLFLFYIVILSCFFVPTLSQLKILVEWVTIAGIYMAYLFPLFLWIYSKLYHRLKEPLSMR